MAEAVGALILTAAGVEGASALTSAIVGTVVITAASTALTFGANYLINRQTASEQKQSGQFVTRQATPSRRRNYGRDKLGGATVFSEVASVGGIPVLFRVIAVNEGEIDAFEEFWLDDNHVFLSAGTSGDVLAAYMVGTATFMVMDTRRGLATETAYATLTANFATLWTSAHRGDGIASLLVAAGQPTDFNNFTTAYPGGTAPNPRAVARTAKVWDPRDGTQDRSNPATWTWSDRPVLIALDYHRHQDGLGMAFSYDAAGAVIYRADMDALLFSSAALAEDWIPAADICDEAVGGIPRYVAGGGYSIGEDAPADVLAQMLAACDGQTYLRRDGAIGIRVGKTVAPAITLIDDHILGYELKNGDDVFLACNEVTGKYTSPAHDYQLVDADPWRDDGDITDRGAVLTKAIALPWVQNHSQCRRLQKIAHARANPAWQGTIVTDMAGLTLLNERHVHLTITEVDATGGALHLLDLDFEIVPDSIQVTIGDRGITCRVGVSAIGQSAYDWNEATEAGTPPAVAA